MPRIRPPQTRPLRALVLLAAAGSVAIGACGSSPHHAATSSTTSATTVPGATAAFCSDFDTIGGALSGLGTETTLAQLRSDLKTAASDAQSLARSGVPKGSGAEGPVTAIAGDLVQLSTWADNTATPADVTQFTKASSLSQLPAAVRTPIQDIENQAHDISGYVTAHCSTSTTTT